jgi:SAM-dependent methyltransferase
MDAALIDLSARARADLLQLGWRERLVRLVPGLDPSTLSMRIHPGDQMFTHSLAQHRDAGAALSQYFAISLQQFSIARQVIEAVHGASAGTHDMMDFACGYGRLLRLLGAIVPAKQTWASDIQPDAVAFVAGNFGVNPLLSHAEPARFHPGRRFGTIWVASLFSHLPATLFRTWLARLIDLLTPDGILCFSVRDASQLPAGLELPSAGLLYASESENPDLDASIYGTTYADEAFVRSTIDAACAGLRCVRLPRALANEQDLYVVAREAGRDLDAVTRVRRGPWGWVDVRRVDRDGRIDLQGWAGSLDDGAVDRVEIRLDAVESKVVPSIARPDVAAAFDDPRLLHSGWSLQTGVARGAEPVRLEVEAVSKQEERTVLYAGLIREIGTPTA